MASPMRAVAEVLSQLMHPNRAADIIRMADADPAFAAKLMEAVQADDFGRSLRMLVADAQWGAAPARPAPVRPEAPAALTTAQRMSRNPDIQSQIQDNLGGLPPELAQRIQAGDPDAAVEAYQMIAAADGELPMSRGASFDDPESPDYIPDVDMMGFGSGSLADGGMAAIVGGQSPPATRQMELPLTADVPTSFSAQSIGPIPTGPDFVATAGPLPGGMDALLQRLSAANGNRPPVLPARQSVIPRGSINRLSDLTPAQIGMAGAAGVGALGAGFLAGNRIGDELFNQDAVPESRAMGGDEIDLTSGDTAALAAETSPPPEVAATQADDFSRIRDMQGFVQEQNADMEELRELKYSDKRTPEQTQYLRMMKVPVTNEWKRVIDEGHVPLGDATPDEIAAADERIRNMVRMGATWDDARTKAYDDMAKGVVARAKQKAEAFLQANPGF